MSGSGRILHISNAVTIKLTAQTCPVLGRGAGTTDGEVHFNVFYLWRNMRVWNNVACYISLLGRTAPKNHLLLIT